MIEFSDKIDALDSKSVENLETISKLEKQLKVMDVHVNVTACVLIIVNRMKSPSH